MIDEKKKQNGMKTCFDRRIDDKVEREFMRDPLIAYTRAFNDAIDWFKNVLWHNASEEPELNKKLVVQYTNYMGDIDYEVDTNDPLISWKDWVMSYRIFKWCYIEDILSGGGEK